MDKKPQENECNNCGSQLMKDSHFCSNCGTELSLKDKIAGISQRFRFKAKSTIDNIRQNLDTQISEYLRKFENNQPVTIGAIKVPDSRRNGVENAMRSFQDKYLGGNPEQSAEYQEWLAELPSRLDDHKCIVCFSSWKVEDQDDIIVCPHCKSGGHRSHIENWIKSKSYCPLCRQTVKFTEFIKIV